MCFFLWEGEASTLQTITAAQSTQSTNQALRLASRYGEDVLERPKASQSVVKVGSFG